MYYRDGLDEGALLDRQRTIVSNITADGLHRDEDIFEQLRRKEATLEIRSEGVVLHLLMEEQLGVLVGMERDVAQNFSEFILECRDFLQDG